MYFCGEYNCQQADRRASAAAKATDKPKSKEASEEFNLGSRYRNASLANWGATNSNKQKVLEWLKEPKNILVLVGTPGTGKTYFCVALVNYIFDQKKDIYYMHTRDFLAGAKRTFESGGEDILQYVRKISNLPFLVIDDLGSTLNTDWQKEVLLELVDRRYNAQLPTVITTNLLEEDLAENLDKRLSRRVYSNDSRIIYVDEK